MIAKPLVLKDTCRDTVLLINYFRSSDPFEFVAITIDLFPVEYFVDLYKTLMTEWVPIRPINFNGGWFIYVYYTYINWFSSMVWKFQRLMFQAFKNKNQIFYII